MPHLPILGIVKRSLKIENSHLKPPFSACHQVQLLQYPLKRIRKNSKLLMLCPKNFPILGIMGNVLENFFKLLESPFKPFINACKQVQF